MDSLMQSARAAQAAPAALRLPAQRIDAAGHAHVDQRAVLALALPLMANSAVQIVLNLTDMWFMGRISTKALAAVGAVQWLVVVVVLVLGGAGTAVQTLVAQNFGARRYARAGQAVWTALWAMACARRCSCWWARRGTWFSCRSASMPRSRQLAAGLLVPARRRGVRGSCGVGAARVLQRHRPATHHAADHARDDGHQRAAQPGVHLPPRLGHRRLGLGDQRGAAAGTAWRRC